MTVRPKVVLFDIGGVCVVSPFRAILDYEQRNNIPPGWVNHSISASSPNGAWQRLERGEILLDNSFFHAFAADLSNESRWRTYYASYLAKQRDQSTAQAAEEALFTAPPVPAIDAEWLYWEMMRISRAPDPDMWPALTRLRAEADRRGDFLVAACSNTSIFPDGHEFRDPETKEGKFHAELRSKFHLFVSSAHVGMRKPDREIYEYTIRELDKLAREKLRTGVEARDIVFLDDIGANLRAARQVGMKTIKVVLEHTDRAVAQLEEILGFSLREEKARL